MANRQRTLNQAKANLNSAKSNLKVQIANAKKVRNQCRCNVQKNTKNQLKIAKKLTGERQKTILREMMVKCLVSARSKGKKANAAAAKCKSLRVSAAYNRKLNLRQTRWAAGVSGADCNKNKYKGGGQGIRYNGMFYRTLDGSNPHGRGTGCENSYRNIPTGCTPVTSNAVCQYMGKHYRWNTHVIVCKHKSYGTVGYSPGRVFRNDAYYLSHSGKRAKTNGCSLRVLLQCK